MARRTIRRLKRVAFILAIGLLATSVIGCCGGFWWTCLRAEFSVPGVRLSYETGGTRGEVRFTVVDRDGAPVLGVPLATESFSGWTQDAITDAAGKAVIRPGAPEVLAVRIGDVEIRFRPQQMDLELLFSPGLLDGLQIKAVLAP